MLPQKEGENPSLLLPGSGIVEDPWFPLFWLELEPFSLCICHVACSCSLPPPSSGLFPYLVPVKIPSFHKDMSLLNYGPPQWLHFNLITSTKIWYPISSHSEVLGVKISTGLFRGHNSTHSRWVQKYMTASHFLKRPKLQGMPPTAD